MYPNSLKSSKSKVKNVHCKNRNSRKGSPTTKYINTLAIITTWGKTEQNCSQNKKQGGGPLPVVHAAPREQCSEHYNTRVRPAQEEIPHFPETHCQATDLFWGKSAKISHKKD